MKRRRACGILFLFISVQVWVCGQANQSQIGSRPLRKVLQAYENKAANSQRIAGGHDTSIDAHPWQVAIVAQSIPDNDRAQFCGGSIIAPHWVVTAAHCVDGNTQPGQIEILVGTASLKKEGNGQRVGIAAGGIIINKTWDQASFNDDIALLHLSKDVQLTPISGPAKEQDEHDGGAVTITGWGAISSKQDPPRTNILQEVSAKIISRDQCNKKASYNNQITPHMLCIGDLDHGQKDACTGDSGGPATIGGGLRETIVGIVSWSDPQAQCGAPKKPTVYTRVSQFRKWVEDNTNGEVKWYTP
jgi:secreted trypsin-like serine protease